MADLVLKSERQIQTQILSTLISELGLNDINPGSVLDVFTQAIAQQDFAIYFQIAQLSRLNNVDSLSGDDLDLKAFEYGLERVLAQNARGTIDILRPTGFEKVSTTFYAGSPAAIAGNTQIDVNDASNVLIGSSGTLIIGRGTNNEEEVDYSVAPTNFVNFYRFTLDSALVNDHAIEETVILKQGTDEIILAGTVVVVPATGTTEEIQFTIDNDVTLLSGEERVSDVGVTASDPGTDANIASGAIDGEEAFPNPPFSGARATNTSKFTTGVDRETDDELRDRIKEAVPSLSRGVKQAIQNAIVGLVDTETSKRVVSTSVILPQDDAGPVKIYIDDGTGFEGTFTRQGFETIRSNSTGGEKRLQLDQFPVVKAQVENNIEETYDMSSGPLTLTYQVGTITESVTFDPANFAFPDIARAEEIVTVINDQATIIEARTSQVGKFVRLQAVADTNESIQITGGTANPILGFPTDKKETLNLYVDDVLLSKDGQTATLDSGNQAPYNLLAVGAFPHDLDLIVDGKSANPQTATITLADVDDPAAVTVAEIAAVINRDIAGITAFGINENTSLRLQSNTERSVSSKIEVTGGDMNDATNGLNFSTTEVSGVDGDYTLNRELGTIELRNALGINQTVTAGSLFTRGKLRAVNAELYAPNDTETLVISVDGGSDQTITFDATFVGGLSASQTAAFINNQLDGATAIVREIGGINFLEINTNTYTSGGSIEIKSSSTANAAFGFTLDEVQESGTANKSFAVSGQSGPFDFAEADSLVVVIDNDIVNNTFNVLLNYNGTVTGATSTTVFADSALISIFEDDDEINDFYIAFSSGANTTLETITTVQDQGSGIFRYTFDAVPTNFADFAIGDLVNITDLDDSENNGNFVITGKGVDYVDVENSEGINASTQTGTGVVSQRRQITDYDATTGTITVGSAFRATPTVSDPHFVIPSTIDNLVTYMTNTKITSLTLKANVEGVEGFTKLQIASKSNGSDGYVQITGGEANTKLEFDTDLIRGVEAYANSIGLIKLVHKTIYGDDQDLTSFPGVGAAGITFQILEPTVTEVTVNLDVTLAEGISIASIENEVRSAVSGYINSLGVGEDVIIERIRAVVIDISGIIDVELLTPTANIAIADNEIGRVSDPDILIG